MLSVISKMRKLINTNNPLNGHSLDQYIKIYIYIYIYIPDRIQQLHKNSVHLRIKERFRVLVEILLLENNSGGCFYDCNFESSLILVHQTSFCTYLVLMTVFFLGKNGYLFSYSNPR